MTRARRAWLGVDVGGQSVKAVLLGDGGEQLAEARKPTGRRLKAAGLIEAVAAVAGELSAQAPGEFRVSDALGIGVAGVMSSDGVLRGSPNLPALAGTAVRKTLADGLGRPVFVDNDANCAALAEGWRGGAAEGRADFLLVTLGSGIGSGLVLGGELHHGATGYACEFGHSIVCADGRLCGCGNRGCLEAYCSESAARALVDEAGGELAARIEALVAERGWGRAQALFALATDEEAAAAALVDGMVRMLGIGLASAVNVLDVPTLVLGGGIAPAVLEREPRLRAAMQTALFARSVETVAILAARHGADAGAVGAARLAMLAERASDAAVR